MITYKYSIDNLDCLDNLAGLNKVVKRILWTLTGTQGEFTHEFKASTELPSPGEEFLSYDYLTEDTVVSWIEEHTDPAYVEHCKNTISAELELKANQASGEAPIPVSPPLPWAEEPVVEETTEESE